MDQYFFFRKSLWRLSLKNPAPEKKLRIRGKVSQVGLLLKSMELFRRFCCRPLSVFLFCSRCTDVFVMDNTFTLFHSPQFYKSFIIRIYANDHNTFLFLLRLLYFDNSELVPAPMTLLELSLPLRKTRSKLIRRAQAGMKKNKEASAIK